MFMCVSFTDVDNETILMTLDQIGQTIDIMTNVVGRLRGYITEHFDEAETGSIEKAQSYTPKRSSSHTIH